MTARKRKPRPAGPTRLAAALDATRLDVLEKAIAMARGGDRAGALDLLEQHNMHACLIRGVQPVHPEPAKRGAA